MKDSPKVKAFSLEVRLTKLRLKHQTLKARIAREMKRPSPCSATLQMLKRQRLRLKDEIVSCANRLRALGRRDLASGPMLSRPTS
ncbi:YdcH family protein [Tritonibacter mobilis]|uniref:YdcH family protein n=1 Tax=Tritonibacter mobilis TaxID=379347 RepID=UPI003A5C4B24